jgi:hypothetical protein
MGPLGFIQLDRSADIALHLIPGLALLLVKEKRQRFWQPQPSGSSPKSLILHCVVLPLRG